MAAELTWRALDRWPVEARQHQHRSPSPFSAKRAATEGLLAREAGKLGARRAVIQLDCAPSQIRADGQLHARALIDFPGVIVSLDSRHGPLRYLTDLYDDWRANLRAIALALEALRAVDRYGVSRSGEQYRGWSALPAGTARDVSKLFTTAAEARRFIHAAAGPEFAHLPLKEQYRLAALRMHPDAPTGDREQWERLSVARRLLVAAHELTGES